MSTWIHSSTRKVRLSNNATNENILCQALTLCGTGVHTDWSHLGRTKYNSVKKLKITYTRYKWQKRVLCVFCSCVFIMNDIYLGQLSVILRLNSSRLRTDHSVCFSALCAVIASTEFRRVQRLPANYSFILSLLLGPPLTIWRRFAAMRCTC